MKSKNKKKFLIMFILLFIISISLYGKIDIYIPSEVEVSNSPVHLGDIAKVENAKENELLDINSIEVITTLLPGYSRNIYKNQIDLILRNKLKNYDNISLEMPERVNVKRSKQTLDKDYLIEKASDFIFSQLDYPEDQLELQSRHLPPNILLPDKEFELEFDLSSTSSIPGNISLKTRVLHEGVLYRQFYMSFKLLVYEEVYIARRTIAAGEKLNEADFELLYKGVSDFQGEIIKDFNNILVKNGVVRRRIPREGVLTTYHLVLPIIVRPHDILQAEIISGGIKVNTQVKARESGRKGDFITVENINSEKRFKAKIISSHMVRLVFNKED
ncbi:MAG: flagellar basal body P-ring formation chaperone FlgA [Halanaerobiales bacterium]